MSKNLGIKFCDACQSENIRPTMLRAGQYAIACDDCGAIATVNPETGTPIAFMANIEIRELRMKAHSVFDKLWGADRIKRVDAYVWLGQYLEISDPSRMHIGRLTKEELEKLIEGCKIVSKVMNNAIPIDKCKIVLPDKIRQRSVKPSKSEILQNRICHVRTQQRRKQKINNAN